MNLSKMNEHERDKNIEFIEEGHQYIINNNPEIKYTSTTTWVHSYFGKFESDKIIEKMQKGKNWKEGHKYWGMTTEEIKNSWKKNGEEVSRAGTKMHNDIEIFMNNNKMKRCTHEELYEEYFEKRMDEECINYGIEERKEWKYFLNYVKDKKEMVPYRTEWMIYHEELKISGSIDMVYENEDGTYSIYDWKRSKEITKINKYNNYAIVPCISHIPDSNFWHYALQLNVYRYILQEKYGKEVKELNLVKLHPENEEKNYEIIKVPIMDEEIEAMVSLRMCTLLF